MLVVDTNVLVYAADRSSPFHGPCASAVDGWRSQAGAWFLTWGIVYEFLRVATHPKVFRRPWTIDGAWGFVDGLRSSPGLQVLTATDRHADVAAQTFGTMQWLSGNLLHDAHTAILMREHGIRRIYTRDADFHRFDFLEVVDPVAEAG